MKSEIVLMLHNIRSVHNIGSMFRTADAFGVEKIYLSGYSPAPIDRFGRKRMDVRKVSLGAEDSVEWEYIPHVQKKIEQYKDKGFQIIALEQHSTSIDYRKLRIPKKVVVIVGSEVGGMTHDILSITDTVVEISMHGQKDSLNVSVALGVFLSQLHN